MQDVLLREISFYLTEKTFKKHHIFVDTIKTTMHYEPYLIKINIENSFDFLYIYKYNKYIEL